MMFGGLWECLWGRFITLTLSCAFLEVVVVFIDMREIHGGGDVSIYKVVERLLHGSMLFFYDSEYGKERFLMDDLWVCIVGG